MSILKVAIQKSGRLSEKSLSLIREAGINTSNGQRKLVSRSSNFPLEVLYLRDDDIPQYVTDKVADIGIVGENVVKEKMPEPWISLRKACDMKGIAYGSMTQNNNRWSQPKGGTPDGYLNGRRYWRPETVKTWILQTDEDLLRLYGKKEEE